MEHTGKGLPTRKTLGAIGDIYTDTETGIRYKCTSSYGNVEHGIISFETEWGKISESKEMKKIGEAISKGIRDGINKTVNSKSEKSPERVSEKTKPVIGVDFANGKDFTGSVPSNSGTKKPSRQNYGKKYQEARDAK